MTSPRLPAMTTLPARLIVAALMIAMLATTTTLAAAQAPDDVVDIRVSCLSSNGRIDVLYDNTGRPRTTYRMALIEQTHPDRPLYRYARLERDGSARQSITGRPDGAYVMVVTRSIPGTSDDIEVQEIPFSVGCDDEAQAGAVSQPEATISTACRFDAPPGTTGVVTAHFVNPADDPAPYIVQVTGRPNTSTTAAPQASSVRELTGLADGDYQVRIESRGRTVIDQMHTVDCTQGPTGNRGRTSVEHYNDDSYSDVADIALGPDGNPILSLRSTSEFGNGNIQLVYCGDSACRGDERDRAVIEGRNDAALGPAQLALTEAGNPVVTFFEGPGFNPEDEFRLYGPAIAVCGDPQCGEYVVRRFGPEPRNNFDPAALATGLATTIAPDGRPLISWFGGPTEPVVPGVARDWTLRLGFCGDSTCIEIAITDLLDVPSEQAASTWTMHRPDGRPVIVTSSAVVECDDIACAAWTTTSTGGAVTVAVDTGPDGFPVLVQRSGAAQDATYALVDCADFGCSADSATRVDLAAIPSGASSLRMRVGATGSVTATYMGAPAAGIADMSARPVLIQMHCATTSCAAPTTVEFASYRHLGDGALVLQPGGNPLIVTSPFDETQIDLIACSTPDCQSPAA